MKGRFSSSSYAVLIAVIRLLIPPEAAHSASRIASTAAEACTSLPGRRQSDLVGDDPAGLLGQAGGELPDLLGDLPRLDDQAVDQHHRDQRREEGQEGVEGDAGRQQRHLVGLGLAQPRLTTWNQPFGGISVGLSASPPGTCFLTCSTFNSSVRLTSTPYPDLVEIARLWTVAYIVSHSLAKYPRV